ncbi:MAG: DUF4157 domain-containing protein [Alphaproteobacteria bacterium]|nr:DUF4157 domain-containing protein [Alphaproteobacteria bacterium]
MPVEHAPAERAEAREAPEATPARAVAHPQPHPGLRSLLAEDASEAQARAVAAGAPVGLLARPTGLGLDDISPRARSFLRQARGGGEPLAPSLADALSEKLGVAMGHVRVHESPIARMFADSVHARAVTAGPDIFLGEGLRASSPDSHATLVHEAVHAAQQTAAPPSAPVLQRERKPGMKYLRLYKGSEWVDVEYDPRTADAGEVAEEAHRQVEGLLVAAEKRTVNWRVFEGNITEWVTRGYDGMFSVEEAFAGKADDRVEPLAGEFTLGVENELRDARLRAEGLKYGWDVAVTPVMSRRPGVTHRGTAKTRETDWPLLKLSTDQAKFHSKVVTDGMIGCVELIFGPAPARDARVHERRGVVSRLVEQSFKDLDDRIVTVAELVHHYNQLLADAVKGDAGLAEYKLESKMDAVQCAYRSFADEAEELERIATMGSLLDDSGVSAMSSGAPSARGAMTRSATEGDALRVPAPIPMSSMASVASAASTTRLAPTPMASAVSMPTGVDRSASGVSVTPPTTGPSPETAGTGAAGPPMPPPRALVHAATLPVTASGSASAMGVPVPVPAATTKKKKGKKKRKKKEPKTIRFTDASGGGLASLMALHKARSRGKIPEAYTRSQSTLSLGNDADTPAMTAPPAATEEIDAFRSPQTNLEVSLGRLGDMDDEALLDLWQRESETKGDEINEYKRFRKARELANVYVRDQVTPLALTLRGGVGWSGGRPLANLTSVLTLAIYDIAKTEEDTKGAYPLLHKTGHGDLVREALNAFEKTLLFHLTTPDHMPDFVRFIHSSAAAVQEEIGGTYEPTEETFNKIKYFFPEGDTARWGRRYQLSHKGHKDELGRTERVAWSSKKSSPGSITGKAIPTTYTYHTRGGLILREPKIVMEIRRLKNPINQLQDKLMADTPASLEREAPYTKLRRAAETPAWFGETTRAKGEARPGPRPIYPDEYTGPYRVEWGHRGGEVHPKMKKGPDSFTLGAYADPSATAALSLGASGVEPATGSGSESTVDALMAGPAAFGFEDDTSAPGDAEREEEETFLGLTDDRDAERAADADVGDLRASEDVSAALGAAEVPDTVAAAPTAAAAAPAATIVPPAAWGHVRRASSVMDLSRGRPVVERPRGTAVLLIRQLQRRGFTPAQIQTRLRQLGYL